MAGKKKPLEGAMDPDEALDAALAEQKANAGKVTIAPTENKPDKPAKKKES